MKFNHSTPVQIRFTDIDTAGHVNNNKFPEYFDIGRIKYFNDIFGNVVEWKTHGLVIVNINIDFLEPIYLNDKIVVYSKINKIGNKSMEMVQQLRLEDNPGIIKATGKTIYVGYHYQEKYSFPILQEWKDCIYKFENVKH